MKFATEELRGIFAAADAETPEGLHDRALLTVLYGAGLRQEEAAALAGTEISDTGKRIRITVRSPGSNERVLTLGRKPSEVLRRWLAHLKDLGQGPRVFTEVEDVLKRYAALAGTPSVAAFIERMRATWASDLYDSGAAGVLEIARLGGWEDLNAALLYVASSERMGRMRRALEAACA